MQELPSASIEELFIKCTEEFFEEKDLFNSRSITGVYSAATVVWLGIVQKLENNSLSKALAVTLSGSLDNGIISLDKKSKKLNGNQKHISSNTGGMSRARSRIPVELCLDVLEKININIWRQENKREKSAPIFLIDGSAITTARSESILAKYPPYSTQQGKFHYPKVKIVAAHCARTGIALAMELGSVKDSEPALAKKLFRKLPRESIVILDRVYATPSLVHEASECGIRVVVRLAAVVAAKLQRLSVKSNGSTFVRWQANNNGKNSPVAEGNYIQAKATITGSKFETIDLFTTVDCTPQELADYYAMRWSVELYIRQVKQTLDLKFVRSRTAENVEKEIYFAYMVFNLIRSLMSFAAHEAKVPLKQISFTSVLNYSRAMASEFLNAAGNKKELKELTQVFVTRMKQTRNARKPGSRSFPRVIKLPDSYHKFPRKPLEASNYDK